MNYVELFAGCGGLSLGLESEDFNLLFANELSPMAAETYAYNILKTDLRDPNSAREHRDKVLWLRSQYARFEMSKRLDENPLIASVFEDHICDLEALPDLDALHSGSMVIGSIVALNEFIAKYRLKEEWVSRGIEIDLLSGGPPCQSFSMAGLRQLSNERNSLPWEFAKTAKELQPKMVLLENVSGILRAFNSDGERYYAWFEVAKAFGSLGYYPLCLHINAKYVGAAQNRPRFIMLALRHDVFKRVKANAAHPLAQYLREAESFVKELKKGHQPAYGSLSCIDVEKDDDVFDNSVLSSLRTLTNTDSLITVKDAIDDLSSDKGVASDYVLGLNHHHFLPPDREWEIKNTELRNNSPKVQSRFRLYQLLRDLDAPSRKRISQALKQGETSTIIDDDLWALSKSGWVLDTTGNKVKAASPEELRFILSKLHSKKQTQRALSPNAPAPAALSIPDDACHYDERCLRTLSVREMARIQSFPDWFTFRSKVTTGGQMRKYQVPQYTQVGNAVPPILGKALGKVCKAFLSL